jgi:hypothetical protein
MWHGSRALTSLFIPVAPYLVSMRGVRSDRFDRFYLFGKSVSSAAAAICDRLSSERLGASTSIQGAASKCPLRVAAVCVA